MSSILNSIPSILMIASPIIITAIGGMICEKSGVVNIALEGLMGLGACIAASVYVIIETNVLNNGSTINYGTVAFIALLSGSIAGGIFSIIHAISAVSFNADQTISGTGINLLSAGLTIFIAQILFNADRTKQFQMGIQTDRFGIYPTAYIALVVIILSWFVLYKLPIGMHLRACGEQPHAAQSVGINVKRIRYGAVIVSGLLAGLAGGACVLTQTTQYTSNTINGKGFIALAAVSFGRWNPKGVALAALLFGTAQALAVIATNFTSLQSLPSEVWSILPYLITLLALVIFSGKNYAPLYDGVPYEKGAS